MRIPLAIRFAALPLAIGLSVALFQGGYLTNTILSYQTCALLISFGCVPLVHDFQHAIPSKIKYILIFTYTILVLLPITVSLVVDLFTGHRRSDAKWYAGIWRVYAILGLWMLIAWLVENKVKPAMRDYNITNPFSGRTPLRPVAAAAEQMRYEHRDKAVAEVYALIEEKAMEKVRTKRRIDLKESQVDRVRKELKDTLDTLKEKKEIESREKSEHRTHEISALESKAENIRERIESLEEQITYLSMTVKGIDDALDTLRARWYKARDLNNYTQFYR